MLYDSLDWLRTHRRLAITLLLTVFAFAVIYNTYTFIDRRGKTAVYIDVFPSSAQVSFKNGKTAKSGTAYLQPGTYQYTISSKGYEQRSGTLEVQTDTTSSIYASLTKEKGEYTTREQRDIQRIEQKAGQESRKYTEEFKAKYPITNYLPVKDAYYSIGYLVDDKGGNFHLTVYTESPRYRAEALKRIRSLGEDPSNYRIEFKDYKNPLTGDNQ